MTTKQRAYLKSLAIKIYIIITRLISSNNRFMDCFTHIRGLFAY